MNTGDIVTRVQRQFGDESGAQITRADIVRWANDGQIDIVRQTEVLQEHRETNVLTEEGSYALPENFMLMSRVTFDNNVLVERKLRDLDLGNRAIDTVSSGTPTAYYQWGRNIYLYPKPSVGGSGNLDIWYVKLPDTLIDDLDTPEIPTHMHEDLVRYCIARARELDSDYEAAQIAGAEYEGRIAQIRHELTTQPVDSYPAVRALPGDDW